MRLTGFEQLAELEVQQQIYGTLPDVSDLPDQEKVKMLNRIINIMGREYHKYDTSDKAMIQNEEIIKALLGIDFSSDDAPLPFVKLREILSTPMQDLLRQMERVPSTLTNLNTLRTIFALMINGETEEMADSLAKTFPQYFRQMQGW